jgi:iron complex outermembrane receptor protein
MGRSGDFDFRRICVPTAAWSIAVLLGIVLPPFLVSSVLGAESSLFAEIPSVYSASKHEQRVTEAPAFVCIVTADEIKKYGHRTLADILRSLPGFSLTYDRSYQYLGARGFSRPGDYNSRLLLLVDGVRMNDSVYDAASIGTEFILDIDLIDRVEVVRGPASSLYGSNALFGVINVITRRGRDLQGLEVSAEGGSLATWKGRLSYGRRLASGLELLLSGSYFESEGDDRLYFPEFDDPATNDGVFEDGDSDNALNFFGKISYLDFTLEGGYSERDKGQPTAAYETVFNDNRSFLQDDQYFIDMKYERSFTGSKVDVMARAYYASYPYRGEYAYDWAEDDDEEPQVVLNRDSSDAVWWGAEMHVAKSLLDAHRLTLGGEYRRNEKQNQKNFDEEVYFDDERDSYFWSLFVQDEWRITEGLILNAGVRYDNFEEYRGKTAPRAALIWSPREKTSLKFLYGEAYRIPNVYEQYYHDGEETTKAASDLEPESVRTYEAIVEQYLGDHLKAYVVGFFYEMDNLITLRRDPADGLLVFENVENVEARGLELELEGKTPIGIEGRASYTWHDAENSDTGEKLTNSPAHLIKLSMLFPLPAEGLFTGAELQYTSGRGTKSGGETDDAILANVTLFHYTLPGRMELSGSVYNLFDSDIAHPASEELRQEVILQDGRTFRLKGTFYF